MKIVKHYPQKKILSPNKVLLLGAGDLDLTDKEAIDLAFIWKNRSERYIVKRIKKDLLVKRMIFK